MANVIVAGADGFIGKNLVRHLVDKGYSVVALGIYFDEEMERIAKCVNVKDMAMSQILETLSGDAYACFYDLAWVGTSGTLRADYGVQLDNVRLTCDYVKLASNLSCPRFVYASSINEMETYEYLQSDGALPGGGYIYGTAKLAAHLMGETVAFQHHVGFIPVIITNIYGVGEKSARLVYTSVKKLLAGEKCSFTEGFQTYDFVYISDAIASVVNVGEKGTPFHRYYIGSGEPKPLREFLLQMRDVVSPGAQLGLGDIPFQGVDIDYAQFDMKKVEKDTGYRNQISFEEGIRMTAHWIRKEENL